MARQKGMLNLSGNLEPLAGAPLDSRDITPTVADLYIASNWPYKYIGMKTTVTATGDTYRLVNLDVTQESSWVKEGSESGQTIQYDELPVASSTLIGKIYQYTGVTNVQYTNGYFYECVNDGGTYKWQQTNTQPGTSYNDFTGATSQAAGAHGLVPAPTIGDISKFLKGDGTWATVPMPSFDYSNTSPEAMNFSTDEKVIGTWIDGKPLYQKTIDCGSGPTDLRNSTIVDSGLTNEMCIDMTAFAYRQSDKRFLPVPYVSSVDSETTENVQYNLSICYYGDTHKIEISSGYDRSNTNIYVTLRYTKTTDTAVASGEKIVGQWIDGKPVFEKVITDTFPTSTGNTRTDKEIDLTSIGIDLLISLNAIVDADGTPPISAYIGTGIDITGNVYYTSNKLTLRNQKQQNYNGAATYIILRYTKSS